MAKIWKNTSNVKCTDSENFEHTKRTMTTVMFSCVFFFVFIIFSVLFSSSSVLFVNITYGALQIVCHIFVPISMDIDLSFHSFNVDEEL